MVLKLHMWHDKTSALPNEKIQSGRESILYDYMHVCFSTVEKITLEIMFKVNSRQFGLVAMVT